MLEEEWELPDFADVPDWDSLTPEEQAKYEAEYEAELAEEWGGEAPVPVVIVTDAQKKLVRKHRMMTVETLLTLPPTEWMLEGLLPEAGRTVVYGAGGSRKSFLVLDWMLCASAGLEWQGRKVKPGKVLYILGEGVAGMGKRLRAWGTAYGIDPALLTNIDFMAQPINLWALKPEQVANWAALVDELGYEYIVIDTLHTAMSGGEESSAKDIGIVYDHAQQIAGRAKLIFVHHDTKTGKSGGRGSSSLRDDADVVISMESTDTPLMSKLSPDKLRDADHFAPLHVHFMVIGDGIESSLVVESVEPAEFGLLGLPLRPKAAEALAAFIEQQGIEWKLGWAHVRDCLNTAGYRAGNDTLTNALSILKTPEIHYSED